MEQDTIVEGFHSSKDDHGLIYGSLIGDGDSGVLSEIRKRV